MKNAFRELNSDAIWQQWNSVEQPYYQPEDQAQATALAECGELSALFVQHLLRHINIFERQDS